MFKKIKKILASIGPGFITGAADDDPSGIATYSQTGAQFGYSQIWTSLFVFPFMSVVQEMCGRIGMVTGKGLAGVIRKYYSKRILYFGVALLVIANTVNIGADLGAMATSVQYLFGLPYVFWLIIITIITVWLQIAIPYQTYAKILKYLTATLLTYVVSAFIVTRDWSAVAYSALVPNLQWNKEYIMNIVAILGTSISPYLFFWQAGEEVEEEVEKHEIKQMGVGTPHLNHKELTSMSRDTIFGMFFSSAIQFFIILTTAATLHDQGIFMIQSASQAAEALKPIAGDFAFLLFTTGIIGTGLLAIPVLAGSNGYAIAETFGWREGLYLPFHKAKNFYFVIAGSTLVGLVVNFFHINPFQMLYYTAVLNGIVAPPILFLIMLTANNQKIMKGYTNNPFSNWLGWFITALMTLASIALIYTWLIK